MNLADSDIKVLIRLAQGGEKDALGALLEAHRAYLQMLARRHLDGRLAARLDDSDLVQQTCISVQRNFKNFQGAEVAEFVAWLRDIHQKNLHNAIRDHIGAQKRAIGREEGLVDAPAVEARRVRADSATPSQRAMRGEEAVKLAQTMERLPPDQREAVRLRYLEGMALAEIAQQMNRSEAAAVGLLKRGMQNLRKHLLRDS